MTSLHRLARKQHRLIAAALIALCGIGSAQAQALVETFDHSANSLRPSGVAGQVYGDVSLGNLCNLYATVRPVMATFYIGLSPGVYYASASYPISSWTWVTEAGQLLHRAENVSHRWNGLSSTATYYLGAQVLYENGMVVNEQEFSRKYYIRWGGPSTTTCLN